MGGMLGLEQRTGGSPKSPSFPGRRNNQELKEPICSMCQFWSEAWAMLERNQSKLDRALGLQGQ